MYNSIKPVNNVNFTAKINFHDSSLSEKRKENISKIFEEKTKEYPLDSFDVTEKQNNHLLFELYTKDKRGNTDWEEAGVNNSQILLKLSDKKLAEKLTILYKVMKDSCDARPHFNKVAKLLPEKLVMPYWDLIVEAEDINRKNILKKDYTLKKITMD